MVTLYDNLLPINFTSCLIIERDKEVRENKAVRFSDSIEKFHKDHLNDSILKKSLVPVHGKFKTNLKIKNDAGKKLEEFYKWQFIYALIQSGLYAKDYIGTEIAFPKGSKTSAPIKLDLAIFSSKDWVTHYNNYWNNKDVTSLDWLRQNLLVVGEFKRDSDDVEITYRNQLKPAMKEKEPTDKNLLGIYFDGHRTYLFKRQSGKYLRYDDSKNLKAEKSTVSDLSLHIPDPYVLIPDFEHVVNLGEKQTNISRNKRTIHELDVITSISTPVIQDSLSSILRELDSVSLVNQRGYNMIIHTMALKIYDELENEKGSSKYLSFFIDEQEKSFANLNNSSTLKYIERLKSIEKKAKVKYKRIFSDSNVNWNNESHVRAVAAITSAFQDFSFVRSSSTDLYQLVFYNFASAFKRDEAAQFLTPLPIIQFIVSLVNPRGADTVFDPCMGIADFLAMSYLNSKSGGLGQQLSDGNLYGVDLDESMVSLATLNLLLAGDGDAKLMHKAGRGSLDWKVGLKPSDDSPTLLKLNHELHKEGNWECWNDTSELLKFDAILTNPPFGEDRAFRIETEEDKNTLELYETWKIAGSPDSMDLGVLFLENAYRSLADNGRLGIVLSNSIASVQKWSLIREWLSKKMRIVALFDLPSGVFAETGVNTSVIIAYKPKDEDLKSMQENEYDIFTWDIKKVGYEKRTRKRNVFFNPLYKLDPVTFDTEVDKFGEAVIDEEFSLICRTFKEWCLTQEENLQSSFIEER